MRAITALSIASDAIRAAGIGDPHTGFPNHAPIRIRRPSNTSRRFRCPLELWWMAKWWTPKWSPVY